MYGIVFKAEESFLPHVTDRDKVSLESFTKAPIANCDYMGEGQDYYDFPRGCQESDQIFDLVLFCCRAMGVFRETRKRYFSQSKRMSKDKCIYLPTVEILLT